MKRLFLFVSSILIVLFYGCSKSSSGSNNTTAATSQWTIGSTTYKGQDASYNASATPNTAALACIDLSPSGSITISFYTHPSVNGTYTVTNGTSPTSQNCLIIVTGGGNSYTSTGKSGDKVNVSFTKGKITASFTNVTLTGGSATTTTTGTIVQQ